MDEAILNDISRLRRVVADAAKEHDNGKDIGAQLSTIADELTHLLERVESRSEELERGAIDPKTRFVSELAGSFLRSIMERRDHVITGSEVEQAVDMAAEIVKRVQARH